MKIPLPALMRIIEATEAGGKRLPVTGFAKLGGGPGVEALTMGGYGGYVWTAFGFALLSMGGLLWQSWRAQARRTEELKALRSTVRGGGEGAAERRPRRLVAIEPDTAPASDSLATPRSQSGT